MAKILAVGIATIDIINRVSSYPTENDEVRVLSQRKLRGGNATNTLVVLSQLGHQSNWAGVLINEPDSLIVEQDLQQHQVNYQDCQRLSAGKMPTSYITLSEETGNRSIIHHRDCPEYCFEHFRQLDLSTYDWVHFEGRNVAELSLMLDWLKTNYPAIPCSLEVEKPRDNIESLFSKVDVLMFSQHYAYSKGFLSATDLLNSIKSDAIMSCAWGADGAWLRQGTRILHQSAFPPNKVIDTLGAGDTFNAGFISALVEDKSAQQAIMEACLLAGKKCGQLGLNNLV